MATLASTLVRQASKQTRIPSSPRTPSQVGSLIHRRALASAADHHGFPKVDFWKEPTSPSKWKEEHFVIISLSGWGLLVFGAYKLFTKGKKNENVVEAAH